MLTGMKAYSLDLRACDQQISSQRAIATLCRDILSIAEISARLDLPLGVTRVLVGDMADGGLVVLHRPAAVGDRPDLALLQRVLYGLQERL